MAQANGQELRPGDRPVEQHGVPIPQLAATLIDADQSARGSESFRSRAPDDLDEMAHLLYSASQGDLEAIKSLISDGVNINGADYDGRTALHLAASEGRLEVIQLLLSLGAEVNPMDRWRSTPLADAQSYGFAAVGQLLQGAGGKVSNEHGDLVCPSESLLKHPDYEIDVSELDFSNAQQIGKGAFGEIRVVNWRGTRVAVKSILSQLSSNPQVEAEFQGELAILQKMRHPNIVQFLGAVTRTEPHMLMTEYLTGGNLHDILQRKGPLKAAEALRFALDIARGMSYLHQHRPEPIVHRDLKPRNLLQDEAGHLKVADFGLSRLLKATTSEKLFEIYHLSGETCTYRYMAPEMYLLEAYDKSVDVFSFALIVHEMFEGGPAFEEEDPEKLAEKFARENVRPSFKAVTYPVGMKHLITRCWDRDPKKRPGFLEIVEQLEVMEAELFQQAPRKPAKIAPQKNVQPGCNCTIV